MELSTLFQPRTGSIRFRHRPFSAAADPCPPLRSFPGVIVGTSRIWEEISDLARIVEVPKGEIIYPPPQGIPPFLYIRSGKFCLNVINEDGDEQVLHYVLAGGTVWDGYYSVNGQISSMPLRTQEKCVLYAFDSQLTFENLLEINPLLVRNLLYSQAIKNLVYSKLALINNYRTPLTKVALFLHEMYLTRKSDTFPGLITQTEMGGLLHLHKVTVSTALTRLKDEGILNHFSKREVSLNAPGRLREIALSSSRK